jgi:type I restriction enzyme M protein
LSTHISQQQLESYLWGAATLLRGTIDAGDYKQFIFPLLFFKRLCDVFDEETKLALKESGGDADFAAYPENHRFQIPQQAHWLVVRQTSNNVGKALQSAMRAIEKANPDKLFGIFGDAQWTNKDRLPDAMLRDLIEHFSCLELTVANLPEDELGQGYEYLIKKFADDSGHTAAEFYTNRTVVHLMTEMLEPQSGESIYDPTCGSGGMLLSCITHLRRQKKEWRNVRLYGQERNLMTSSIARMNCFLHGIEDFQIVRGDTLSEPKLVEGDRLMRFDVVLANPPYSIKQWDRDAFASDPWGRNLYGTPPQGRADYAFWQHILQSLDPKTGRFAILFPHGVLFRQEEAEMRRKLIEADVIECVLGLGPNLFYNSPMEACVVICRMNKPKARRGRILFINAVDEVTRERAQSFLTDNHVQHIVDAYVGFRNESGFARVATIKEVGTKDFNLSIPLFVEPNAANGTTAAQEAASLSGVLKAWLTSGEAVASALKAIIPDVKVPNNRPALNGNNACKLLTDRAGWTSVRFGDVVENVNETESDPMAAGIDRYIGLEHLEPGSLHIRTWGDVAEGTTFTRRCRPGQLLFGKRRAYQRKVALAEFDAIVSGDIYVFAPKNDRLLPELLPFICLSERFFNYAVETSAGSLSPRTNWSSLSDFTFNLPPIDQQQRIAEILWTLDVAEDNTSQLFVRIQASYDSQVNAFFFGDAKGDSDESLAFKSEWKTAELENIVCSDAPIRYGIVQVGQHCAEGVPTVAIKHLGGDFGEQLHRTSHSVETKYAGSRIRPGDLLLSIKATVGEVGLVPKGFHGNISRDLARIRCGNDINPEVLLHLFRSKRYRRYIDKFVVGSTRKEISIHALRKFAVPIPPAKASESFLSRMARIRDGMSCVMSQIQLNAELRRTLVNQLTGRLK